MLLLDRACLAGKSVRLVSYMLLVPIDSGDTLFNNLYIFSLLTDQSVIKGFDSSD